MRSRGLRQHVPVAGVVGAVGLTSGLAVGFGLPLAVAAALIGLLALLAVPAATVVALLLLAQEVSTSSGIGAGTPFLGLFNQLYSLILLRVPLVEWVLIIGAAAGVLRLRWNVSGKARGGVLPIMVLVCGVACAIALLSYLQGTSLLTAVGQAARPYILIALAFVCASTVDRQPGGMKLVGYVAAASLLLLCLAGATIAVLGRGASLDGRNILVYYDAALPAVAGAAVMGGLLTRGDERVKTLLMMAAMIIVLLSFRRNVWLAMIVAGLFILVYRRRLPWRGLAKGLAWSACLYVCAVLVVPGVVDGLLLRAGQSLAAISGGAADYSTDAHLDDISVAWRAIGDAPFLGFGMNHAPLSGLAVQEGALYVHNSFLLEWLRFGPMGGVALGVVVVVFGRYGLAAAGGPPGAWLTKASGCFLLIAPVCSVTAGFLTATSRWPALLGLAAGYVAAGVVARRSERGLASSRAGRLQADLPGRGRTGTGVPVRLSGGSL
jgi:hypothetical protein